MDIAESISVYEVGGCEDFETKAGAEDDANILANTPLLLLTLPPLEVEDPLTLASGGGGGGGNCKTPVGFSGISNKIIINDQIHIQNQERYPEKEKGTSF